MTVARSARPVYGSRYRNDVEGTFWGPLDTPVSDQEVAERAARQMHRRENRDADDPRRALGKASMKRLPKPVKNARPLYIAYDYAQPGQPARTRDRRTVAVRRRARREHGLRRTLHRPRPSRWHRRPARHCRNRPRGGAGRVDVRHRRRGARRSNPISISPPSRRRSRGGSRPRRSEPAPPLVRHSTRLTTQTEPGTFVNVRFTNQPRRNP